MTADHGQMRKWPSFPLLQLSFVHKGAIVWDPSAGGPVILAGAHVKNPVCNLQKHFPFCELRKFFAISLFISPFYKTATAVAKNI
jgi:hypothetical protein